MPPVQRLFVPNVRLISAKGEAAALPLVVRAHDDRDIFQRHDDHHRPEDQAEDAVDVELVGLQLMMAGEGLAERVDRRGADSPKTIPTAPMASL